MRQDPDVIMIGEIRDEETASLAVQAALTGHLVFTTVHTNDALSSINRLLDLHVPSFLLAGTVVGMIAQRLIRRVCPYCRQDYSITIKDLNKRGFNFEGPEKIILKHGTGCHECRDTGYFKRESVYEVVGVDDDLAKLIVDEPDMLALKEMVRKKKFSTLWENAIRKMLHGITTPEEVSESCTGRPAFSGTDSPPQDYGMVRIRFPYERQRSTAFRPIRISTSQKIVDNPHHTVCPHGNYHHVRRSADFCGSAAV